MALPKNLFILCLTVSVFCLAAGYGMAGQWLGVAAAIITLPAWLLARKYPAIWLPFICLLASISLAVAGILSGPSSLWMISSSGFSLAAWDLLSFNHQLGNNPSEGQTQLYENHHIRSLAPAVAAGTLAGILGHLFVFQIPFAVLVILIILVLFGLDRTWAYIKKDRA
jgi:hypothetical protein